MGFNRRKMEADRKAKAEAMVVSVAEKSCIVQDLHAFADGFCPPRQKASPRPSYFCRWLLPPSAEGLAATWSLLPMALTPPRQKASPRHRARSITTLVVNGRRVLEQRPRAPFAIYVGGNNL